MEVLVSIIVPVYNVSKYIGRCIESIQRQTYKNLEIILVNDGSKDDSYEKCQKYAENDKRIILISQDNAGVSAARNRGLDKATGQYIMFVDSDDYIHQEYVQYLLELCVKYNCKISQIQYTYVYDEPENHLWEALSSAPRQLPGSEVVEKKWTFEELFTSKERSYRAIVCGKLFKTELFQNYRFPEGRIYEDEEASFFLCYFAENIMISSARMYYYFMSQGSIMRNKKKTVNWDFLVLHKNIISFLEKENRPVLLNTERKELCIRLMMNYFNATKNRYSENDKDKLKEEFRAQYVLIKKNEYVALKEWVAISLFFIFPNVMTALQNSTGLIQKAKVRRVQNSK